MCQDHIFGCYYFQRRQSLTNVKTWTNALLQLPTIFCSIWSASLKSGSILNNNTFPVTKFQLPYLSNYQHYFLTSENTMINIEMCFNSFYMRLLSFYNLWQHQNTRNFLMFPWGREKTEWCEMGQQPILRFFRCHFTKST